MVLTEKQKNCPYCQNEDPDGLEVAKMVPEINQAILDFYKCKRIKPIKRTRKRQIAKAKHMLAWHDHTSYEWSQWWSMPARKPKRWK